MDFVHDKLHEGRRHHVLTVVDQCTGEALDVSAGREDVRLNFSRPGKPTATAHIASFNAQLRA